MVRAPDPAWLTEPLFPRINGRTGDLASALLSEVSGAPFLTSSSHHKKSGSQSAKLLGSGQHEKIELFTIWAFSEDHQASRVLFCRNSGPCIYQTGELSHGFQIIRRSLSIEVTQSGSAYDPTCLVFSTTTIDAFHRDHCATQPSTYTQQACGFAESVSAKLGFFCPCFLVVLRVCDDEGLGSGRENFVTFWGFLAVFESIRTLFLCVISKNEKN
ncbi:hypothetical protein BGW80DRAFT_1275154, partial [Lactifluus volemus]